MAVKTVLVPKGLRHNHFIHVLMGMSGRRVRLILSHETQRSHETARVEGAMKMGIASSRVLVLKDQVCLSVAREATVLPKINLNGLDGLSEAIQTLLWPNSSDTVFSITAQGPKQPL